MKFFLAICTIALVAQVSLGASISKREADDKKDVYAALKEMLPIMRTKLEVIYKEIPDTDAYAKYRKAFEDLFKMYDETNEDDLCVDKIMKIMDKMMDMMDKGEKDESEEAAKIKELFAKHKDSEFEKKYAPVFENAKTPSFFDLMETC